MALGFPHPKYLLPLLSARDLVEWEVYAELEPFGEQRADLRAGIIAAAMRNTFRTKDSDPIAKPSDFMPEFEAQKPRKKSIPGTELHNKILSTFIGMGAVDMRKK